MNRPNIIYIMTDQLSADCLGFAGNSTVKTPNIDALAAEGLSFSNAYAPAPTCAPARAAVFSGMYPPANGVTRNWMGFRSGVKLLPEKLKTQGYHTANIGKLHFVPHTNDWGFNEKILNDGPIGIYCRGDQEYSEYSKYLLEVYGQQKGSELLKKFDEDENQIYGGDIKQFILGRELLPIEHTITAWTSRRAVSFLDDFDSSSPLFLHLSFFAPHQPWLPVGKWKNIYSPDQIELPQQFYAAMEKSPIFQEAKTKMRSRLNNELTEKDYKQMIAYYYGNVSMLDYYIGKVFAKLKEKGLWENSLIIFSSDHGDHNGKYGLFFKSDLYDSCLKVPLITKLPGSSRVGQKTSALVNTLDLHGTILEAAGAEKQSKQAEFASFYPVLKNEENDAEYNTVYSILCSNQNGKSMTMLREGDFKLIRYDTNECKCLYELYDMKAEPLETENLYDHQELEQIKQRLKLKLDKWAEKQNAEYKDRTIDYTNKG